MICLLLWLIACVLVLLLVRDHWDALSLICFLRLHLLENDKGDNANDDDNDDDDDDSYDGADGGLLLLRFGLFGGSGDEGRCAGEGEKV